MFSDIMTPKKETETPEKKAAKPAKVQTADEMTDATEAVYREIGANSS